VKGERRFEANEQVPRCLYARRFIRNTGCTSACKRMVVWHGRTAHNWGMESRQSRRSTRNGMREGKGQERRQVFGGEMLWVCVTAASNHGVKAVKNACAGCVIPGVETKTKVINTNGASSITVHRIIVSAIHTLYGQPRCRHLNSRLVCCARCHAQEGTRTEMREYAARSERRSAHEALRRACSMIA